MHCLAAKLNTGINGRGGEVEEIVDLVNEI